MYPDDQRPDRCPVRLYLFYQSKKPAEALKPDFRFFLNSRNITTKNWEDCSVWYAAAPMGHNTLASAVTRQIELTGTNTKALKLTGTSIRKTGIDGSMTSGMPSPYVSILYGQKSLSSKLNYMSSDDPTMKATNRVLQNVISGQASAGPSFQEIYNQERAGIGNSADTAPDPSATSDISSHAVSNSDTVPPSSSKESKMKKKAKRGRKYKRHNSSSSSSTDSSSEDEMDYRKEARRLKKRLKQIERSYKASTITQTQPSSNPGVTINLNLSGGLGLSQNPGQVQGMMQPQSQQLHTRTVTQTISKSDNSSANMIVADELHN